MSKPASIKILDTVEPEMPEIVTRGARDTSTALEAVPERRRKNTTRKSLAQLNLDVAAYPEAIRAEVQWMQAFLLDHCRGNLESLRAICAKLGHDKSFAYFNNIVFGYYFSSKATTWKPGAGAWSEFLELSDRLRRYAQQAAQLGRMPFVVTPSYTCIANFITEARSLEAVCRWRGIMGPTGAQKSKSFKHYVTLNNHGMVTHFEAPARPSLSALQYKVALAYHIGDYARRNRSSREAAIRDNLNESRTIIIDNVQRLFAQDKGAKQECFDWLLEVQDDTDCTIILSFTNDFAKDLTESRAKGYFEQFIGRMGGLNALLRLPDYAPAADLRVIARAFDLDPGKKAAMELLATWSRQDGRIRIAFERLQRARTFAELDGRKRITLADLQEANDYVPPAIGSDDQEGGDV